mmetsp:Transcript_2168/g.4462  ORF Transcript_2168/g.4462 Transcript_2168/m.4462 type:complete len:219 (-) Transcript_2168:1271-1927(-)
MGKSLRLISEAPGVWPAHKISADAPQEAGMELLWSCQRSCAVARSRPCIRRRPTGGDWEQATSATPSLSSSSLFIRSSSSSRSTLASSSWSSALTESPFIHRRSDSNPPTTAIAPCSIAAHSSDANSVPSVTLRPATLPSWSPPPGATLAPLSFSWDGIKPPPKLLPLAASKELSPAAVASRGDHELTRCRLRSSSSKRGVERPLSARNPNMASPRSQ